MAGDSPTAVGPTSELVALRQELAALKAEVLAQHVQLQEQKLEEQKRRLTTQSVIDAAIADVNAKLTSHEGAMDSGWLCICGALVMFMHAGFAMLETGCCRAKNASNVLMKNLVNVCVGTIGWWIFGFAFAYGEGIVETEAGKDDGNEFIGHSGFVGSGFTKDVSDGAITALPDGATQSKQLAWFFQWAFCTAAATIVSGGVAERVKSPTFGVFAFCMTSFIYPPIVAWTWGYGWLSTIFDIGFMDFAGSGIVHLTGGVAALVGTIILQPRKGRFENPEDFDPHNLPLVVLGTFSLWFGWYGFNPGSTLGMSSKETGALAAHVAMNTTLAAAIGGITVFMIRYALLRKYDVGGLCNGILGGLVSITAGCGNVESGSAVLIGFIGAFVYQGASMLLVKFKIDDPVDASPVHGACGIWGVLAAAIFDWGKGFDIYHGWGGFDCTTDDDGCMSAGGKPIAANFILIIMVLLWSGTLSGIAFGTLKVLGLLRIDEETEDHGMDHKQHSPPKAYSISAPKGSEATV